MRWPWTRPEVPRAEYPAEALRDAQERLRRAHEQSDAIVRRAEELARALPAGGLYLRLAAVLARHPRNGHS